MSEPRVSASQPQGPAFTSAPKASAPVKAAKPSKVKASAKRAIVPAKTNAKGAVLRCAVKMGATQCANPGRHAHGRGFTCTTHDKAIAKGAKVTIVAKATAVYAAPAKAKTA
jgi:hypothetical protein